MKSFISFLLMLLCVGTSQALDVKIRGTKFVKSESFYNYYAELLNIASEKKEQIKKIEYDWHIEGKDIFKKSTLKDKKEGNIETSDFKVSSNDFKNWPSGLVICIVTVTYNDDTTQSASDNINVTMVP